jgi:hypothetical protein
MRSQLGDLECLCEAMRGCYGVIHLAAAAGTTRQQSRHGRTPPPAGTANPGRGGDHARRAVKQPSLRGS